MSAARRRSTPASRDARLPERGDPEVLVDIELVQGSLWLVLVNLSDQPAFDVSLQFGGPLVGAGGERDISEMRVFRRLPVLRPKREIRVFIDVARHLFARRQKTAVDVTASWRSRERSRFAQRFRHDLAIWKDFGEVG